MFLQIPKQYLKLNEVNLRFAIFLVNLTFEIIVVTGLHEIRFLNGNKL